MRKVNRIEGPPCTRVSSISVQRPSSYVPSTEIIYSNMRQPEVLHEVTSNEVHQSDLHGSIMAMNDQFVNSSSYQLRRSRRSGNEPLVRVGSELDPTSTSTDPQLDNINREEPLPVSSSKGKVSVSIDSPSASSATSVPLQRQVDFMALAEKIEKSKPVRLGSLPHTETISNSGSSNKYNTFSEKSETKRIRSWLFEKKGEKLKSQSSSSTFGKPQTFSSSVHVPRVKSVPRLFAEHHDHTTKREAHWVAQGPPLYGLRYPSPREQHAKAMVSPHHHRHHHFPALYGSSGHWHDSDNATTTDPGNGGTHPYNVVGLLLAAASVIFIIIGIAFVFTRVRRRKPSPDQPDTGDLEMVETTKPDPYAEWLNMPEEEPPKPALKKQVKTVVRTVSRKMSLTPKPHEEVFTPGVPEHLRYQLKQIYVY